MRRFKEFATLMIAAWTIAFAFMLLEFHFLFHFLGPALIRSAAQQAALLILTLPLVMIGLRPVLRRTRNPIIQAAAMTTFCFIAVLLAELTRLLYLAGHGWLRTPYDRFSAPLSAVLPLLMTSVHGPLSLLLGVAMTARWLEMSAARRDAELRVNHLETRLSESRAQLLRSQLHPHFLFNSLNSVAALIRNYPARASEMLDRLAQFYAIAAATEGRRVVSLREELSFVQQYIDIEQIRFGPRLDARIDVPRPLLSAEVPTLILQPLAENAIKHGIGRQPGPGRMMISANVRGSTLDLVIEDSGALEVSESRDGVGLANTRERLRQLYGDRAGVSIQALEAITRVTVTIPYSSGAAA